MITFADNEFQVKLEKGSPLMGLVKSMPTRRFDWDRKIWIAPLTEGNLAKMKEIAPRFELSDQVEKMLADPDALELPPSSVMSVVGKKIVFVFEYDETLKDEVKALGCRFSKKPGPNWAMALRPDNISKALDFAELHGFFVSEQTRGALVGVLENRKINLETSRADTSEIKIDNLGGTLMPFQGAGVEYAGRNERVLIGDEMGLGKTVQGLATLELKHAYPAIIVCPANLKINWYRETRKWLPHRSVSILSGRKLTSIGSNKPYQDDDIVIINYEILGEKTEIEPEYEGAKPKFEYNAKAGLLAREHKGIILDESHLIKNHKAQRSMYADQLAKGTTVRLCLTGTPVLNRPSELISQLRFLGRLEDMGGFWHFAQHYCGGHHTRFGYDMTGSGHLEELNERLRATCYVRRTKAQVLPELPPKRRASLVVPITNRREYDRAEKELIEWLKENKRWLQRNAIKKNEYLKGLPEDMPHAEKMDLIKAWEVKTEENLRKAEQLVRIEALKQLAVTGKMKSITDWIDSFLETGEKLIVFAVHQEAIDELAAKYDAPAITGKTPKAKRQEYVDAFQEDPNSHQILILNLQAGGVGLTLTAASNMISIEFGWNPSVHDQAEARPHRIGQKSAVNVWYFIGQNTIDEEIDMLIEDKRAVVDAATDGNGNGGASNIMSDLIAKLTL